MKSTSKFNVKPVISSSQEVMKIRASVREANDAARKSFRDIPNKEGVNRLIKEGHLHKLMAS